MLVAYFVTMRIAASYLFVRLAARFLSESAVQAMLMTRHRRNARLIHRTISSLQGLFIKIGQLISIMTNFLPDEFRSELEGLQDRCPARPYGEIEARLVEELGRPPGEVFASFDAQPVASASIGQVHRATSRDGRALAVKVQYPDVEEIVRIDLRALRRIFRVLSWFLPVQRQGLVDVYREVSSMILAELDFKAEADHLERIAANFTGRTDIGFPKVVRELSTTRVIVTEWIDGVKVSDGAKLAVLKVDRRQLARTIVNAYCKQIFSDGVYHADPHPGNLMVRVVDGKTNVVFLDFGAVAEVSPRMRRGIADLITAALTRDTPRLIASMKSMGFISRAADPAVFDRVIDFFHQRLQEEISIESFSLKDIKLDPKKSLDHLADLSRMGVSIRDLAEHFHVPKEWILLERTVLLLMGLCTELDPAMNPIDVIRPYLEEFVLGKDRDWSQFLVGTTKEMAANALALPAELKKVLTRAQRGDLEVRFRGLDEHARLIYALGHQLIYAAGGIAASAFAVVFDGRGQPRSARAAWIVACCSGGLLLLSMLTTRRRRRR
jgi:predicted unusual protein kinase regulating ubiquinone biosynthesis (AarF/ABC1/UbiB family)